MKALSVMLLLVGLAGSGAAAPPANDAFANPVALASSADLTFSASLADSSYEGLEPESAACDAAGSVWFAWTAPSAGLFVAEPTDNASIFPKAAVFSGTTLETARRVEYRPEWPARTTAAGRCAWPAEAGKTYRLRISARDPGTVQVRLRPVSYSSSNSYEAPVSLGSTAPATWTGFAEGDFADRHTGGAERYAPLPRYHHWSWTAPAAGRYRFTVEGDTLFFDGSTSLFTYGERQGFTGDPPQVTGFFMPGGDAFAANERAHLVVSSDSAWIRVTVTALSPPPNDLPENATPVTGEVVKIAVDPGGATRGVSEPFGGPGDQASNTVWYRWLAPFSGPVLASGEADVWLFGGPDVAHLVPAHNGDLHFQPASVVLGQSYWLRVAVLSDRSTPVDAWLHRSTQAVAEPTSDAAAIPAWWEAPASGSYLFTPYGWTALKISGPGLAAPAFQSGPQVRAVTAGGLYLIEKNGPASYLNHIFIEPVLAPVATGNASRATAALLASPYPNVRTGTFEATDPYGSYDSDTWWRWVAPATGPAELSYADSSSDFQRTIEIVEGAAATGQIRGLASPDTVEFWATAGSEYRFRIHRAAFTPFRICARVVTVAPHFTEATAIDLGSSWPVEGRGAAMNASPGPWRVWWKWVAPDNGFVSPFAETPGPWVAPGPAPEVFVKAGADPASAVPVSTVELADIVGPVHPVTALQTYWISTTQPSAGRYHRLRLTPANNVAPFNDDFANRLPVAAGIGSLNSAAHAAWNPHTGELTLASVESGEYSLFANVQGGYDPDAGSDIQATTWWTYQPTESGIMHLYQGAEPWEPFFPQDLIVGIFTGDSHPALFRRLIAVNDALHPITAFPVEAGETLAIGIGTISSVSRYSFWLRPAPDIGDFSSWALRRFPGEPDKRDPTADPASDGIANVLKWALGLDPTKNSTPYGDDPARENLPAIVSDAEGPRMIYRLGGSNPDLVRHHVEYSVDGQSWGTDSLLEPESLGDGWYAVRLPLTHNRCLFRLHVTESLPPD